MSKMNKHRDYETDAQEIFQTIQMIQRWIHNRFHCGMENEAQSRFPHELTIPQFHMLVTIKDFGPLNLRELAERLKVSTSSASLMLDKLVMMGLVKREQCSEDRREIVIELTAEAEKSLQLHKNLLINAMKDLLENLDEQTVEKWLEVYREIRAFLNKVNERDSMKKGGK